MRRVLSLAVIVSLAALPVLAQPPKGRPGFFGRGAMTGMLLTQKSVQEELKLDAAQLKKVEDLSAKQKKAMEEVFGGGGGQEAFKKVAEMMQGLEKEYAALLKPDQAKRLKQISYQVQGGQALTSPDVAKELGITEAQQEKMREVQAESFKLSAKLRDEVSSREEMRKKTEEINAKTQERLLGMLTAEQKTKWKEMIGEPFKGQVQLGFPGLRRPPE